MYILYPFNVKIVWRLSESAFLCAYFGGRTFYFGGCSVNLLLKALSWVNCLLSYMYEEEDDDPLIKGIILIGCVCIVGVI